MRRVQYLVLIVAFTLLLPISCETAKGLKGSITSKMGSFKSSVDDKVYSQVPAEDRQEVQKAEFDLKVAKEKVRLADLNMDLVPLQRKYAGYEEDLADKCHEKAAVSVDLAKLEAIDKSGLGQANNVEAIADLRAEKLKLEADIVQIEAKMVTTERRIKNLTKKIENQAEKIESMKMPEAQEKVATESPSITKEEQKIEEQVEKIEGIETPEVQEKVETESPSTVVEEQQIEEVETPSMD